MPRQIANETVDQGHDQDYGAPAAPSRALAEEFDVVLSKLSMNGGTAYELRPLLIGRPSSLFYSLAVEEDCWWIPGVRGGNECMGDPALRPEDFFRALVYIVGAATADLARGSAAPAN